MEQSKIIDTLETYHRGCPDPASGRAELQEEDLAKREADFDTKLHTKDKDVEKLAAQWTQELDQRHKETLDAQALVHAGKVKELEVERDELKEQALKLSQEKDTLNDTLTEVQGVAISKAGELSEANKSIKDLTLKLEGLEGMLTEAKAREGTLAKELETEKQLQRNEAAEHKDFKEGVNRWIGRLEDVAGRITAQLATMGMPNVRYAPERSGTTNAKLTLFFECVLGALEQLHANRAASLADEARRLCKGAMTKVLTKLAHSYPDLDFDAALESLPEGTDLAPLRERIKPIISRVGGIQRVEGQRRD